MSGTTTTTASQSLTPAATAAANQMFGIASNIANQQYTPYPGPQTAPFTPQQQEAFRLANEIAGSAQINYANINNAVTGSNLPGNIQQAQGLTGGLTGSAQQAGAIAGQGANLLGTTVPGTMSLAQTLPNVDLTGYMNPYTQAVLDPALEDLARRADVQRNQLRSQQAMTGSFGGSRGALAELEQERNVMGEMGRLSANERSNAFNQGVGQFRLDQQNIPRLYGQAFDQLGAAQGLQRGTADITGTALRGFGAMGELENQRLGQLGFQQQSNLGRLQSQVNPLLSVGGLQQALTQSEYDQAYRNFVEQRDYPFRGLGALQSSLGQGGTLGATSRTTQQAPRPNPTAQAVGAITAGVGALPGLLQGGAAAYNLGSKAWDWLSSSGSSPYSGFSSYDTGATGGLASISGDYGSWAG